jgi:hypothetical protein
MGHTMTAENDPSERILSRALGGDAAALAELFDQHRLRLRQMIRLRLDTRVGGVDPSDVLQKPISISGGVWNMLTQNLIFLWMRMIVGQRLIVPSRYLGAYARRQAGDLTERRPLRGPPRVSGGPFTGRFDGESEL